MQSNPLLWATLLVLLLANSANAQADMDSASSLNAAPAAREPLTAGQEPLIPFESPLKRSEFPALWISDDEQQDAVASPASPSAVKNVSWFSQPAASSTDIAAGGMGIGDAERFAGQFSNTGRPFDVGTDLYSPPEFEGGLIIFGRDVAMKIGGFVKADFIYDFDPIDSTDSFVTTTIPVGAPPRTNARYHARQTRLSFDTRWEADGEIVRIYVESDFFGKDNLYQLRHAYGEVGELLVGRTWTTFTDVAAAPATLDFEGSVSSVNRRQAQARWTRSISEDLTLALAVEDARFLIELPPDITAEPRSPSPDFIGRIRLEREWGRFQIAGLYRVVGVQPTGEDVVTGPAWGFNFPGVILLTSSTKTYYQIVFGKGIGSYRSLLDAAPSAADKIALLPLFGWMVGVTHDWNDQLNSNFTYAENSLDSLPFQDADDLRRTTYLAINLIWNPLPRVNVGIEYLYGLRKNVDLASASANRVQIGFIFDLP